jgi:pectate lyase
MPLFIQVFCMEPNYMAIGEVHIYINYPNLTKICSQQLSMSVKELYVKYNTLPTAELLEQQLLIVVQK